MEDSGLSDTAAVEDEDADDSSPEMFLGRHESPPRDRSDNGGM